MLNFISRNGIRFSEHEIISKLDNTTVNFRLLGSGEKIVLLANGVGTNFFFWLSVFRAIHSHNPDMFNEVTIIAPIYRGLFTLDSTPSVKVNITMSNSVEDTREILTYLKKPKVDTIIGWSMGAQMALLLCDKYPETATKLFLLNPSTGETLHTTLQPFIPMPNFIGEFISKLVHSLRDILIPACDSSIWPILKQIAATDFIYYFLVGGAFLTGAPPEQPSYFFDYVQDIFSSRSHTKHLLDLIVSLDATLPNSALKLSQTSVIASGIPDIMTGIYHSIELAKNMPNAKHIPFTMASHFLLIEWPQEVAQLIVQLLFNETCQL